MEKVLWLTECVQGSLWSFLVLLTFCPNNPLLWGCLMYWKMFNSTPGLYPLEIAGASQHIQNIQINQVIGENKMCLVLQKKHNGLFGQPNISFSFLSCQKEGRKKGNDFGNRVDENWVKNPPIPSKMGISKTYCVKHDCLKIQSMGFIKIFLREKHIPINLSTPKCEWCIWWKMYDWRKITAMVTRKGQTSSHTPPWLSVSPSETEDPAACSMWASPRGQYGALRCGELGQGLRALSCATQDHDRLQVSRTSLFLSPLLSGRTPNKWWGGRRKESVCIRRCVCY